jgi:hypothetical protein
LSQLQLLVFSDLLFWILPWTLQFLTKVDLPCLRIFRKLLLHLHLPINNLSAQFL